MLDLTKVAQQMQGVSRQLTIEAAATLKRLDLAQTLLHQAQIDQAELVRQRQIWQEGLRFMVAEPLEPLDTCRDLVPPPAQHTVMATDGSQIAPSHHEIAYCYLINVGRVRLDYGQNRQPLLDSLPEVFYQPEDLYPYRQWGIRTEEWMGLRRTQLEATVLAELACGTATTHPLPCLALVDGSLIHWSLEGLPQDGRDRILTPMLECWTEMRRLGIPLVGYLSASRGSEALNFLRLQACPHPEPNCDQYCGGERADCQVLEPLRDVVFWSQCLQPGQRGPLWRSSARILDSYGEHRIYFCHVHAGSEVVRLEFPAWVGEDEQKLALALGIVLAQVQKGYGYPVALAEAHNQAVVRGGDRARFFALLEQEMIRAGLRNVGTSYKEARKRGSIA
uniref:NurA domain-containing protein n=1 Tax=Cyanothece sp. (strain PCC 7425 / ATCC 29141) TaxID=395961 RepID=B8HUX9_CYAP4